MWNWLGDNSIALIGLLATLALLGVTAWYAKTTKDMAIIARNAAQESSKATAAAERSAEASLDAARVAQSQIQPVFVGRAISVGNFDGSTQTPCLLIESQGDAVVVQEIRIRRGFRKMNQFDPDNPLSVVQDVVLEPYNDENSLPRRLHRDEGVVVRHAELDKQSGDEAFVRFILDVRYTFSEDGGAGGSKIVIFNVGA
jgi:hypothetical protein